MSGPEPISNKGTG